MTRRFVEKGRIGMARQILPDQQIMRKYLKLLTTGLTIVVICAVIPVLLVKPAPETGQKRDFYIKAELWEYSPYRIVVDQGDEVTLRLASKDVVHGFHLENHHIEATIYPGKIPFYLYNPDPEEKAAPVEEISFVADRWGKFNYRCSVTCGTLHPFMLGDFIVRPNYPFKAAVGATLGVLLAAFILMFIDASRRPPPDENTPPPLPWRLNLLATFPGLRKLVSIKGLQFALYVPIFASLIFFLIAGFYGSPIGNKNIIVTIVWIFWWFLLICFMVPFGARIWCMACPFPFLGEWLQRRKLLGPGPGSPDTRIQPMYGLKKKWPSALSNIWLQNVLFLSLCTFSAMLVTRPITTAVALLGLTFLATFIHYVYRKRTFCNYVCPVGGWMGLYSMAAMVEVRSQSPLLCAGCKTRACMAGNERGWSCPWAQNPSKLSLNNYCGVCMECIKTCDNSNMTLKARPFCSDTDIKGYDQAWMSFIMITLALVYSATYLGPWGFLKRWANISEVLDWQGFSIFAGTIWFTAFIGFPAVWFIFSWFGKLLAGQKKVPASKLFMKYSYLLVPLGLTAWISFSLPAVLVNNTHILSSLSDPMGWGWDLFGTAHMHWKPFLPQSIIYIQIASLLLGLTFSMKRGYEISQKIYPVINEGIRSLIPLAALITGITLILLRIFAG
jgi:hypothetical protein